MKTCLLFIALLIPLGLVACGDDDGENDKHMESPDSGGGSSVEYHEIGEEIDLDNLTVRLDSAELVPVDYVIEAGNSSDQISTIPVFEFTVCAKENLSFQYFGWTPLTGGGIANRYEMDASKYEERTGKSLSQDRPFTDGWNLSFIEGTCSSFVTSTAVHKGQSVSHVALTTDFSQRGVWKLN